MKTIALFAGLLICLTACHNTNKKLKEVTVDADSIAINYFKGDGSVDTVVAVKIIRDKNSINKLSDYVAANSANTDIKCGYDGSIHFFKRDSVVQDVYFRMNEANCMLFTFTQDGTVNGSVLTDEAKLFLQTIQKQ
jgi:hypothetical protein